MSDNQPPPSKRHPPDDHAVDVNAERPRRRSTRSRGAGAVPKEQPTNNPDTPTKKTPKVPGASPSFAKSASVQVQDSSTSTTETITDFNNNVGITAGFDVFWPNRATGHSYGWS